MAQFANQRAANPRPDVTDMWGYGPSWGSYAQNLQRNVEQNFPTGSSDAVAKAAYRAAMNIGPLSTVFHGSPHLFDKFDMSKIGTGEGAQAYGHGLYFAENPAVAKDYARAVTTQRKGLGTLESVPYGSLNKVEQAALADIKLAGGDVQKAIERLKTPPKGYEQAYSARLKVLEDINSGKRSAELAKGALYKVDLPDEAIGKMLDWDSPLSQQPESVRKAVAELMDFHQPSGMVVDADRATKYARFDGDLTGAQVRQLLELKLGIDGATKALRESGIPGIRYLDQGSRGSGQGTSNFVVFDDQLPKIIGRE